MPYIVCRRSDGVILGASRWDAQPYNAVTQVRFQLAEVPTCTLAWRWDGEEGLRAETSGEMAARQDTHAVSRFDDDLLLRAVAMWTAQKVGVSGAVARNEILTIYRNLLT